MYKKNKKYEENSKKRLSSNMERKFRTTMIGSIAAMEDEFGHLWGQDLAVKDLSVHQREWREVWGRVRSRILDNGNANLRAAQNEIAQYTISWDRYVTKLPYQGV